MTTRRHIAVTCIAAILGCNQPDSSDATGSETGSGGTSTPATEPTTTAGATSSTTDPAASTTTGDTTADDTTGGLLVSRRVFITAASFHGDLAQQGAGVDGIDGADRLCTGAAAAAGLGSEWVAWVSSSTADALPRLADDARWTLLDEATQVFASRGDVQFGPEHPIDMTEAGDTLPPGTLVWTNTDVFGKNSEDGLNDACEDWSGQTGVAAVGGLGPGLSWTDTKQPQPCGNAYHLYCFER